MSRLFALTIMCLFLSRFISAQEQESVSGFRKSTLFSFSGAYSMPMGPYKAIDSAAGTAGNAGGGFIAQLQLNWIGKKDFGFGGSYIFQQNYPTDEAKTISPDGMPIDYFLGDQPWSNHYLLLGPLYMKDFSGFVLDLGLQVGVVIAKSSNFSIWVPAVDSTSQPSVSTGAGFGFAYQARVSAGYRITERIILKVDLSYLGASPSRKKSLYYYSYIEDPPGSGNYIGSYQGSETIIKKKISTFNPGIGITIKF